MRGLISYAMLLWLCMAQGGEAQSAPPAQSTPQAQGSGEGDGAEEAQGSEDEAAPVVDASREEAPPAEVTTPDPGPRAALDLLWMGPGCVTDWSNNISAPVAIYDYFRGHEGTAHTPSVGSASLRIGARAFISEQSVSDGRVMGAFVEALPELRAQQLGHVNVLVGPREMVFQGPTETGVDWLGVIRRHPIGVDLETRRAVMRRYQVTEEFSVLEVDWSEEDAAPLPTSIDGFSREWAATTDVRVAGQRSRLFFIGARWGSGPRAAHEIAQLRERADGPLLLHAGGLFGRTSSEHAYCVEEAVRSAPSAMTPRMHELRLGPETLRSRVGDAELHFVASNLRKKGESELFFAPYRRLMVNGVDVLLVGVVDPDQLLRLPASMREEWDVEDPGIALSRTLREVRDLPRPYPQVVVAMVASDGAALDAISRAEMVDVVFGDFSRNDTTRARRSVSVDPSTPRHRVRNRTPLLRLRAHRDAVGRVSLEFDGDERPSLRRIEVEEVPVGEDGPRDERIFRANRQLEERSIVRGGQILLPDVGEFATPESDLAPLVWGERILYYNAFRTHQTDYPASMTDPLWMRFVTNTLRAELGVDVAISRNLPRTSSTIGPLQRTLVEDWLQANDEVYVVNLTGAQLNALRGPLRAAAEASTDPERVAYASGFNPVTGLANGRPIDPARIYRVAVTDSLAAIEGYSATLTPLLADESEGEVLRDIVLRSLARWTDGEGGDFDPEHRDEFAERLADASQNVEPRWDLALQELSVQGTFYTNTGNTTPYAATRETRVVTPNNLSLAAKLRLSLRYEGPAVGWETSGLIEYQRVALDIEGVDAQEAVDNVLVFSELRLNATRISLGQNDAPLMPFLRAEFDSELTATRNPMPDQPDFPHQKLLRETLGLLLVAGQMVPEVRLGITGQHDFSSNLVHDIGLSAGLKLAIPMGPVRFTSDSNLRYLFNDSDDRTIDLGMVFRSNNRVAVGLSDWLSLYVFADVFLVRGKVPEFENVAGSVITGVGLQLSGNLRL